MIMSAKVTAVMAAEEVRAHPGLTYLKERRIAMGYSIREMAKMIGTTHATYAYWERGGSWPSSYWLPLLAEAMRCSIEELFLPISVENVFHLPDADEK